MHEIPRTRHGWILLVTGVLVASTIVTAALSAAVTQVLFPGGFLVDVEGQTESRPSLPPSEDQPESTSSGFGLRASVTCAIAFGNVEDSGGPENLRP